MAKIVEIAEQNSWWKHDSEFERYDKYLNNTKPIFFKRKEFKTLKDNIYIFRGCRRVGKTTYLRDKVRKLLHKEVPAKSILYLSVDFFTSRREFRNALNYFLDSTREARKIYLLLDEITSLGDWERELKYLADQGITNRAIVIATGSSAIKLKEKGELLPGRKIEGNRYFMKPLCFREFVLQIIDFFVALDSSSQEYRDSLYNLKKILVNSLIDFDSKITDIKNTVNSIIQFKDELKSLMGIYLITGGFPNVINHYLRSLYEKKKGFINPNLAEEFVASTIGDLARIGKQEIVIRSILEGLVKKYGSRYSFSNLSSEIQRNHKTTIEYLNTLEDSFVTHILYSYDLDKKNIKLKGEKKVYFLDPFIYYSVLSYLKGTDIWDVIDEAIHNEESVSALIEGIVTSHLLMSKEKPIMRSGKTFLWSYYNRSGREIDALLQIKKGLLGVEVKYQSEVDTRDILRVKQVKNYIILSKDDVYSKDNTIIVPVDVFLSLIPVSEKNI